MRAVIDRKFTKLKISVMLRTLKRACPLLEVCKKNMSAHTHGLHQYLNLFKDHKPLMNTVRKVCPATKDKKVVRSDIMKVNENKNKKHDEK